MLPSGTYTLYGKDCQRVRGQAAGTAGRKGLRYTSKAVLRTIY